MGNNRAKYRITKFDTLLVLFIAIQASGGLGNSLQPVRICIVLSLPFIISYFLHHKTNLNYYKYEIRTFTIWMVYGIISLLWVIHPADSIKEIIYLFVNFSGFLLLLVFALRASNSQSAVVRGWILLFLLTVPIALYELWFDIHLPMSYLTEESTMNFGYTAVQRRFASVTFMNLNGYNTVLTYIIPFALSVLLCKQTKIRTAFSWGIVLLLGYIILSNGSRAATICLIVFLLFFLYYYIKNVKTFFLATLFVFVAVGIAFYYFSDGIRLILLRFNEQGLEDFGRSSILHYGWTEVVNSMFLGIGAGDLKATMETVYRLPISASHNFFVEVGVQYGILIFILFIGLFIRIFIKARKNPDRRNRFIVYSSLCLYPIISIINSGYILHSWTWLFIASLYVIADKRYNIKHG